MNERLSKALVLTILQHAEDFPWRVQDIGLMSLRLDDRREYRLHIWDPSDYVEEPPIHDHPYDFTSTIIAGEMTNTRYEEDPAGDEYVRFRFPPGAEGRAVVGFGEAVFDGDHLQRGRPVSPDRP